jgi:acetyl esterase/lipase
MKKYTVEKRKIPSTGRDIKILIFRPTAARKAPARTPGVLWIHGGGYATGMAEMAYFSRPLALVKKYGAVCASAEKSGSRGKSRCVPYRFPCF